MQQKILVVGGGLAGLCIAMRLIEQGHQVTLVDDNKNASSAIAAGIVNPFSFRRTLLSWSANPFFFESELFYRTLNDRLNQDFFKPIDIRRLFATESEAILWYSRMDQAKYKGYMYPITDKDRSYLPFGSGRIKGFWIDAPVFINACKAWIAQQAQLITRSFQPKDFNQTTTTYFNEQYDAVVFALGYRNHDLPWFSGVPVGTTKGQILTVKWNYASENTSLHRKAFALPIGPQEYKLGSTYEWDNTSLITTEEGKQQILKNFTSISTDEVEVIHHLAGIRPTSPDRRPMIGAHHLFPKLFMFNGLGTKGYMLAPSLSSLLADAIVEQKSIPAELSPYRFKT
jgi:glycine/D-amino acid oxidase-like deaminating enzyme